jgi:ribonuclease III
VNLLIDFFKRKSKAAFKRELKNILGFAPDNLTLYKTALTHRSLSECVDENNERLEYLGDAILSAIVADYLFRRYPYQGEGFLTEMRSKMVNRLQLNEVALKIGLKKITRYNKQDISLRSSHIFGNALESLVGAVYLDHGYKRTQKWVQDYIIAPHMFMDELESKEINNKNKLYGWANRYGKNLEFITLDEKMENGRRLFTVGAVIDGQTIAHGKAFNKKDASQIAANLALDTLNIKTSSSPENA